MQKVTSKSHYLTSAVHWSVIPKQLFVTAHLGCTREAGICYFALKSRRFKKIHAAIRISDLNFLARTAKKSFENADKSDFEPWFDLTVKLVLDKFLKNKIIWCDPKSYFEIWIFSIGVTIGVPLNFKRGTSRIKLFQLFEVLRGIEMGHTLVFLYACRL